MLAELQNLAQSPNVALVLSLIANVILAWAVARLFRKLEASVSSKELLLTKLAARQLKENADDAKTEAPVAPPGV